MMDIGVTVTFLVVLAIVGTYLFIVRRFVNAGEQSNELQKTEPLSQPTPEAARDRRDDRPASGRRLASAH
jgi:hypothetical protein